MGAMDTGQLMGLLGEGEELTAFHRGQRKQAGLLNDGILVLTNKRFLWVEESGDPVTATFDQTVGVVHHDQHLSLRFDHDWLSIFCAKPMVAKQAAQQCAVALNNHRKQQSA